MAHGARHTRVNQNRKDSYRSSGQGHSFFAQARTFSFAYTDVVGSVLWPGFLDVMVLREGRALPSVFKRIDSAYAVLASRMQLRGSKELRHKTRPDNVAKQGSHLSEDVVLVVYVA